jgi:plasmid stabilization system protein ParE
MKNMSGNARAYRLTPQAERDLEEIWFYTFENWSAEQADRYHNQIMAAIERLAGGAGKGAPLTTSAPATAGWPWRRMSCFTALPTPGRLM